jgi:hypothetical protein
MSRTVCRTPQSCLWPNINLPASITLGENDHVRDHEAPSGVADFNPWRRSYD